MLWTPIQGAPKFFRSVVSVAGGCSRESSAPSFNGTISVCPDARCSRVRVDLDPGVTFPMHSHPGEEIIYVLGGVWEYQAEGKGATTLKAGDVLFIPAGVKHGAKNVGSGKGSELATYIVEKGKPLVVLAK
jgi:quercetin dioxygenase-like cupin family protein